MADATKPDPAMTEDVVDLSAVDSQQVLESLADAVVVADEDNRILYVNASAEGLLGWDRAQLVGRPLVTIIPERLRPEHLAGFRRYRTTREPRLIGTGPVQVPALRADGSEVEVELTLTAHALDEGREMFVASLRDLTERLALQHERAISRYLLAMREIAGRLSSAGESATLEQAAPVVLSAMGESLGWDLGGVWVAAGDELHSLERWCAPGFEQATAELEDGVGRFRRGEGLPGRVLETGEPAWVEDLRRDENLPRRAIAERYRLRSCFAFPIVADQRVVAARGQAQDDDGEVIARSVPHEVEDGSLEALGQLVRGPPQSFGENRP